jgi:predicted CxxxxCH...CXXCH cytochrome family protein
LLDCGGCHGVAVTGAPTTGNHTAHITAGATCYNCHSQTSHAVTANQVQVGGAHINGAVTTLAGGTFKTTITVNFSGTTSCSTITCHGNANALWGNNLNCDGCHGTLSGAHNKHMGKITLSTIAGLTNRFDNFTANRSTGNDTTIAYGFGCANCHPVAESGIHIDGTVQVQLAPVAGASTLRNKNTNGTNNGIYNGDKSCDVVYCHGDGKNALAVGANGKAPIWTAAFANADRCANCHGNNPTTSAHSAHIVGIHYDDVFSGTSDKLPKAVKASNTTNAAHGYGRATTINCNICHNSTVTTPNNDKATTCSTATSCHGAGGVIKGNAAIALMQNHVNGKIEVQFANVNIKSKAQVRPTSFSGYTASAAGWARNNNAYKTYTSAYDVSKNKLFGTASFVQASGTCDNVVCHNNKQVQWVPVQPLTCDNCHGRL